MDVLGDLVIRFRQDPVLPLSAVIEARYLVDDLPWDGRLTQPPLRLDRSGSDQRDTLPPA
jgi:hypothetical protein